MAGSGWISRSRRIRIIRILRIWHWTRHAIQLPAVCGAKRHSSERFKCHSMQVQAIFCNQIQYWVFRIYVRARILKFLSKPSPTPIYYPQVFASALSRNSSDKAIAILRASRAHPLARWFAGRRIPSQNLRSRIRGVLQKSQALHLIKIRAGVCASHYALEGLRTLMFRIILHWSILLPCVIFCRVINLR